jgi:hypothetical protein
MSDLAGTADVIASVDGEDSYVRIQVPANAGALDRGKQLAVVDRLTPSPPTPLVTRRSPAGHGCCSPRSRTGAGSRRAREYERHTGGCRPAAGGVAPAARDPGQATRLRTNSASFWRPESIWLMEEP